jgi:hypothetical protein
MRTILMLRGLLVTLLCCCFVKGDFCGKNEVGVPRFGDEAAQRDLEELSRIYG